MGYKFNDMLHKMTNQCESLPCNLEKNMGRLTMLDGPNMVGCSSLKW